MLPTIAITDAATAYLVAEALRSQADADRRVADRLTTSRAYAPIAAANMRTATRLLSHAQRLDNIATECERQGYLCEADNADTVVMPVLPFPPVGIA